MLILLTYTYLMLTGLTRFLPCVDSSSKRLRIDGEERRDSGERRERHGEGSSRSRDGGQNRYEEHRSRSRDHSDRSRHGDERSHSRDHGDRSRHVEERSHSRDVVVKIERDRHCSDGGNGRGRGQNGGASGDLGGNGNGRGRGYEARGRGGFGDRERGRNGNRGSGGDRGSFVEGRGRGRGRGRGERPDRTEVHDLVPSRSADLTSKRGTTGQPVNLLANFFVLDKRPNWCIYHYRVDFVPEETLTPFKKSLVRAHEHTLGAYMFDGSSMYTAHQLDPHVC